MTDVEEAGHQPPDLKVMVFIGQQDKTNSELFVHEIMSYNMCLLVYDNNKVIFSPCAIVLNFFQKYVSFIVKMLSKW